MNGYEAQKVIVKLNRDTKEDKIKWEVTHNIPSSLAGTEKLIDNIYVAKVSTKKVRLYKYEYKHFYEEETFFWLEAFRLEFIDFYEKAEWEFPKDNAVEDLYDSVRYKTSNVEDFFKDYLADE